jgi:hypothetical protein
MATVSWRGDALAVKHVEEGNVGGTVEVGDLFTSTVGAKNFTHPAASTTLADVADAIASAWNALSPSYYPEFAEVTALGNSDGTYSLTADTPGKPFTVTLTTTEAGGGAADDQTHTLTSPNPTDNAGPANYDTAGNWSGAAIPVATNDVVVENSSDDITYGLDQSGVALTSFTPKASFTGDIGLPANTTNYAEYRGQYLQLDADTITIGQGDGDGSGRIKLVTAATATELNIYKSGRRAEAGVPAILWKGTHASTVVTVNRGDLGVAFFAGETATILTLNVGYINTPLTDAKVHLGSSVTLTTANIDGGQTTILNAVTTINQTAGEVTVGEDATVGTLNLDGGTCYYKSTGTCTAADVDDGAVLDFRQDGRGRTVTNCTVHSGGAVYDPNGTVTWTNPISCPDGLDNVTLELGPSVTVTA